MIGRLRGSIAAKLPGYVVVDVDGVGYEVAVTPRALVDLPGIGEPAVVHTHLHVREDAMALYGFPSLEERDLFRLLLGASGVGPKVALAISATLTPAELRKAVLGDDVAALCTVPGIGKRTAQKLILELRPRLDLPDGELPGAAPGAVAEVREALEGLGYDSAEIRAALGELPEEGEVQELLRAALRSLGRERHA